MREIGSEFWDVPTTENDNGLFSNSTRWFQSGRSALLAIIAENNFKTVAIPEWCCESIVLPFKSQGIEVEFYPFGKPISADAVLVMDFFGYIQEQDLSDISGVIIRDTTHSLFSKKFLDADYYFGSLRKWAGFYTGGYVDGLKSGIEYGCNNDFISLRSNAMKLKSKYINECTEDKTYFDVFATAEGMLEDMKIFGADERDISLASKLDVSYVKQKRQKNARVLLNEFSDIAVFNDFGDDECPMFVPILVPNKKRDALRTHLIQNNVYCPIHWPGCAWKHVDDEISLVCDQRYSEDDIQKEIDLIKVFI